MSSVAYDVVFDGYDPNKAPKCPHGPALLFERFCADTGTFFRFFACSANRDRRHCKFYQVADEPVPEEKVKKRKIFNADQQPKYDHLESVKRFKLLHQLPEKQRIFCKSCYKLMLPAEKLKHNSKHDLQVGLTSDQLCRPSQLLSPLENNSTNAQYLFSEKATKFILDTIQHMRYDRVLCVGAPRIHEAIQNDGGHKLDSLLLDIDHRYVQFYPPDKYCRYNMFNNHFFDGEISRNVFIEFLHRNNGKGVIMVTDPPFGGLVDVLVNSMKKVQECWRQAKKQDKETELPILWIFPYFLEPRILQSWPTSTMLDYKVEYENHDVFKSGPNSKSKKKGSPVRIFTNIPANLIPLPAADGYRFCSVCDRFVAKENKHCALCNSCTSKDGSTYRHCHQCNRCVKPIRIHCQTCKQCMLPNHKCNDLRTGCHICGKLNHKRKYCPHREKKFGTSDSKLSTISNDSETFAKGMEHSMTQKNRKRKMGDETGTFQISTSLESNSKQTSCCNKDNDVVLKKTSVKGPKLGQVSRTVFNKTSKWPMRCKVSASQCYRRKKIMQI
ncbi:rRNA N6-adenosine-methyltransferase ZCCHC4-like [Anneissia japonica]|uniref:rRNA N6-adenosine-methyltransferase ZCCHC4-like n=1 Tax=Anneissia japonica TaxID=1529436 RepID=UPI001425658A|nr:rRNA N6-adenosine-methyltransferase ZCCHC4-like [Anneissia japonica]